MVYRVTRHNPELLFHRCTSAINEIRTINESINLAKLDHLSERYEEAGALLSDGDIISDQNRFRSLSKEYAELEPVVKSYQEYQSVLENIEEAKLLFKDSDEDMRDMGQEELRTVKPSGRPWS